MKNFFRKTSCYQKNSLANKMKTFLEKQVLSKKLVGK